MNITWVGSPNFDSNRKTIDRIVIHWIVGNLASADAQFQKKTPGTSAHYGIEDKEVHQYVKETDVAYHAGVYTMNQRSIGIEHSASPDREASDTTYQTSGQLVAEIAKRHNIPLDRTHIIGHKEVKATQCPGTIDIDRIIAIAKGGENQQAIIDELREARDKNWNLYQDQIKVTEQKDDRIKDLEGQVSLLEREKAELRKANTTLMEKNLKLVEAIEKDTREDYDFELKYIELEDRYKDLETEIEDVALVLGVTPTSKAITEAITNIVNEKPVKVKKIDSLAEGITLILNFLKER